MAAVDVTAVIELTLVGVDQGAASPPRSGDNQFDPLVLVVLVLEGDEVGAAQRRLGQPAAPEAFQRDRADRDAGSRPRARTRSAWAGTPAAADRTPRSGR